MLTCLENDDPHLAGLGKLLLNGGTELLLRNVQDEGAYVAILRPDLDEMSRVELEIVLETG